MNRCGCREKPFLEKFALKKGCVVRSLLVCLEVYVCVIECDQQTREIL